MNNKGYFALSGLLLVLTFVFFCMGSLLTFISLAAVVCLLILGIVQATRKSKPQKPTGPKTEPIKEPDYDFLATQHSAPSAPMLPIYCIPDAKAVNVNNYVVVDCETTGLELHDRITEIAAIKYKNGVEVGRYSTMVNPETPIPINITRLTGITDADVAQAPPFEKISAELNKFLEDLPIVAHNAEFDAKFLYIAFARADAARSLDYIDTCNLARQTFPGLQKYKLESLCQDLHITNRQQSHRAEDDAERAAKLFDLCKKAAIHHWTVEDVERRHQAYLNSLVIHPKDFKPQGQIDKTSPLYKKTIAFTGDFTVSRQTLAQQAVNAGAVLRVSVTPTLNYLVVGKPNEAAVGYDGISRKEKDAHALISSGKSNLKILSEADFAKIIVSNSDT